MPWQERVGHVQKLCLRLWNKKIIRSMRDLFPLCALQSGRATLLNQEIAPMKKFVIVLAAATLAASPTLAKKYRMPLASGPIYQTTDQGYAAYAYAPERASRIGAVQTDAVYAEGQYLGADPDPFIRQQLLQDPPTDMQ
jgi:hypothetical protein